MIKLFLVKNDFVSVGKRYKKDEKLIIKETIDFDGSYYNIYHNGQKFSLERETIVNEFIPNLEGIRVDEEIYIYFFENIEKKLSKMQETLDSIDEIAKTWRTLKKISFN